MPWACSETTREELYNKAHVPNRIYQIEYAYRHLENDAAKVDFIQNRPVASMTVQEKGMYVELLRELFPKVQPYVAVRNAVQFLNERFGGFRDNLRDAERALHTRALLSTRFSDAINKIGFCKVTDSDASSCPRSYEMSCSYYGPKGNKKALPKFTTYRNCE
ncbi:MAG: hypothetical protein HN337_01930 [Deltaproteobacteria bacterium]|jgi:hypothetical protein|nr:hypothetical protein [Deltaproteobacteria bacterium]